MESWIWLIVIIVTLVVEVVTVGNLISIWFTFGAIAAYLAGLIGLDMYIQFAIFAIISLILIFVVRPLATNYLRGNIIATNADRLIGQHLILSKAIAQGEYGEVKFNGVIWNCISQDEEPIEEKSMVLVLAIDGSKLIVKSI